MPLVLLFVSKKKKMGQEMKFTDYVLNRYQAPSNQADELEFIIVA